MSILKTEGLKKYYGSKENITKALDGVDISIEKGEFVAIIGASGSGKSTLLNMIGGLDIPTSGKISIGNRNVENMKPDELTVFRRKNIGFIFQNYNLIPVLNVIENITLPVELDGKEPEKHYIDEIIRLLGLKEKIYKMPAQLSGGQQQRVAIARALASKPKIILADEPTGNLDSDTSEEVINLLVKTSKNYHQTIVMITHDPHIAAKAERVIKIRDGKVIS
ncbi:ABC transporter ATP-binding protein [Lachnospiraceae bacterium DSM 108991]|uniref:ABC transporter ATP-binding protein n=1 Tax=Claveliimonas monacensis TaxID=2779351 RepID=A0ABR9RLT6_9FIRM|nr:ABC transporter ATP-binding protein [Claveliimonas monacensis]MBE5063858.1 ABC transporter ATP-binding protein [Claveliimonas monacensis]